MIWKRSVAAWWSPVPSRCCVPARVSHAIPQLKAAHELFARQGVLVVGLHTVFEHHEAMTPVSLRAFLLENQIRFTVGVECLRMNGGPIPQTMQTYQMQGHRPF